MTEPRRCAALGCLNEARRLYCSDECASRARQRRYDSKYLMASGLLPHVLRAQLSQCRLAVRDLAVRVQHLHLEARIVWSEAPAPPIGDGMRLPRFSLPPLAVAGSFALSERTSRPSRP